MKNHVEELKVTYTDILSLGESNKRIELFDGDVIMTAMPDFSHQHTAFELAVAMRDSVKRTKLGVVLGNPMDVVLSPYMVFQPDVSFISNERAEINDGTRINGAPDLVVEVLSESTEERDRTIKFREYARGGAREYWLVSVRARAIEVYENSPKGFRHVRTFGEGERLNTSLFPDIQLDVASIFP